VFIVWRKRPVKGEGGGPFLTIDPDWLAIFTCWMPLRCDHAGRDRVAWTPLVVHSLRIHGKPRQEILERFPTIRSCCIDDRFNRAAWWHRVQAIIRSWSESLDDGPRFVDYSRDGPDILRKLREVVPRPGARGVAEFEAFRLAKEEAYRAREEAERGFDRAWHEAQERARANERRRRQEEALRDLLEGTRDAGCFAVLGLAPDANIDQVKGRYRDLAKLHHPDRGGDAAEFHRINDAYDRACGLLAGRIRA
jgi:hypothetical protein